MGRTPDRTYRIADFAALTGVTARALRHYDRLGLLRPRRSSAGYRLYAERDFETLEEIVALQFIGIPLKEIVAIRRRSRTSFRDRLRAQRRVLEARRGTLARAVAAVAAAEAALESDRPIDAALYRHIIEVMQMDTNRQHAVDTYLNMLKAKAAHLAALSAEQRATFAAQWSQLVDDVRTSIDEDPSGPKAQALLDRWTALLQALTGVDTPKVLDAAALQATPGIGDDLWNRRAEWLPGHEATESVTVESVRAQAFERAKTFADSAVLDFINRARAARR